ncbi:MAG: aminoglycoside phosphotransferase family protein [Acidobacteriota bacterium]
MAAQHRPTDDNGGLDAGDRLWERLSASHLLDDLRFPWEVAAAVELGEHASQRRFFRLRPAQVGKPASTVLVLYPLGADDEVQHYRRAAAWMCDAGVRVPQIYAWGARALLVEDGGDRHLADASLEASRRQRCYLRAIDEILAIQRHGQRAESPNPGWALDARRLRDELEYTERYALSDWLGASGGRHARARGYERLVEAICRLPTAICHRDFHARNLMVADDSVLVLDYQDAMIGPQLYDLASLLWDNYCEVPQDCQQQALRHYWARVDPVGLVASEVADVPSVPTGLPAAARQAFCLVALQRHLKALGTFAYQIIKYHRHSYARSTGPTWRHARRALQTLGWGDLLAALRPLDRLIESA